jgi:hypothetical protein
MLYFSAFPDKCGSVPKRRTAFSVSVSSLFFYILRLLFDYSAAL